MSRRAKWPGLSRRRIGLFKVNSWLLNGAPLERSERSGTGAPFNRMTRTLWFRRPKASFTISLLCL